MPISYPTITKFMASPWPYIQPHYQDLLDRPLNENSVDQWLSDWSHLRKLVDETNARLRLANSQDTNDVEAEKRYHVFLGEIYPPIQAADQKLKEKFLASGLQPEGMEMPIRRMRAEVDIFDQANLPLIAEEHKLGSAYNKIFAAQTVEWEGEELTLTQLRAKALIPEREIRARAWHMASARQLADREAVNELWGKFMFVRHQLADNACMPDFRAYSWKKLYRFDYTPDDSLQFQRAIEQVVVPVATRIYEKHRQRLGLDTVRPWDLRNDLTTMRFPPLRAYENVKEFEARIGAIFQRVDPQLGDYFAIMCAEELLDLENRKGKGPGGYCTSFATQGRPFIFMNAIGMEGDVRVLLHEAGHAFHVFERTALPYHHQWRSGMEFNEVASTAMELLTTPYLTISEGGFFSETEAARFRIQHLENMIVFWPYMAIVSAFQHWVYENHDIASDPANCDAKWTQLVDRYMPAVDWSGLEQAKVTGWHRKLHIHRYPFYYIEYGLSSLGAVQIWRNALQDQFQAVADYKAGLALGGTASISKLYETASARLAFDSDTLQEAVDLIVVTLAELGGW